MKRAKIFFKEVIEIKVPRSMWEDIIYPPCGNDTICEVINKFLSTPEEILEAEETGAKDNIKRLLKTKKERKQQLLTMIYTINNELENIEQDINELENKI